MYIIIITHPSTFQPGTACREWQQTCSGRSPSQACRSPSGWCCQSRWCPGWQRQRLCWWCDWEPRLSACPAAALLGEMCLEEKETEHKRWYTRVSYLVGAFGAQSTTQGYIINKKPHVHRQADRQTGFNTIQPCKLDRRATHSTTLEVY